MCKCCCSENHKKDHEHLYECKKCGKTGEEQKYCCGEQMKQKK